jgi:transcription initiation factor IIF auxiliary subunit
VFKEPPFMISEKGWGEFDMQIVLTPIGAPKGGEQTISHDLNFQQNRYESTHNVVSIALRRTLSCACFKLLTDFAIDISQPQIRAS